MNGYQLLANTYRRQLDAQQTAAERAAIQDKITAFSFLADATEGQRLALFDSGAFNDVCKGFLLMTLNIIGESAEGQERALNVLTGLLDEQTAEAAARLYHDRQTGL